MLNKPSARAESTTSSYSIPLVFKFSLLDAQATHYVVFEDSQYNPNYGAWKAEPSILRHS
jgi:hypothetical protein